MGHSDGQPGRRVVAYIDGFNVYYGLKAKGWVDAKWLDYRALMESFLLPGQHLEAVRYYLGGSGGADWPPLRVSSWVAVWTDERGLTTSRPTDRPPQLIEAGGD